MTLELNLELNQDVGLERGLELRQQLKIEIKRLQDRADQIDKDILGEMGVDLDGLKQQARDSGLTDEELKAFIETFGLSAGRFDVTLTGFVRETLNEKKLLEAGVTMKQLKRGKVSTPVVYPRVTESKEPEGN